MRQIWKCKAQTGYWGAQQPPQGPDNERHSRDHYRSQGKGGAADRGKYVHATKRDSLHAGRQAASFLGTPKSVQKLFDSLGSRLGQRAGGYTRITRPGPGKGDGAELAMLELVGSELVKRAAERAKRKEERLKAEKGGSKVAARDRLVHPRGAKMEAMDNAGITKKSNTRGRSNGR